MGQGWRGPDRLKRLLASSPCCPLGPQTKGSLGKLPRSDPSLLSFHHRTRPAEACLPRGRCWCQSHDLEPLFPPGLPVIHPEDAGGRSEGLRLTIRTKGFEAGDPGPRKPPRAAPGEPLQMPSVPDPPGRPTASHLILGFLSPSLSPLFNSAIFLPKGSKFCPQFSRRPAPAGPTTAATFSWAPGRSCSPEVHTPHDLCKNPKPTVRSPRTSRS